MYREGQTAHISRCKLNLASNIDELSEILPAYKSVYEHEDGDSDNKDKEDHVVVTTHKDALNWEHEHKSEKADTIVKTNTYAHASFKWMVFMKAKNKTCKTKPKHLYTTHGPATTKKGIGH